ncbi:MAG: thiamine pyrophosphate-binding protein [Roseiflexus sp.]|nr:thiamine pyrophosphate-binding protein [Roseiflexus sp.]MCS7290467.1 thiamine pyrophosphate-binding protein [Roseiflexus sp.]MDW8231531.1 thiamine pyrophosphate-binding protein [Roseiflexaceae bacterium]
MHGGDYVALALQAHGVRFVFTLTGGHIAPILVGCRQRGLRVIDTRHEATAVFAADAVARLTGVPGVAVVTAGPGVTNTITAIKNAQMAQSPLVVIGGAAATALRGRGALQDIDQIALMQSITKWRRSVERVRDIVPTLEEAFYQARSGVPGPVFVELPVDLLYDEQLVRQWYGLNRRRRSPAQWVVQRYLNWRVNRLFAGARDQPVVTPRPVDVPDPEDRAVRAAALRLVQSQRPLLLAGSQAVLDTTSVDALAGAITRLGVPTYLSGTARGLLGTNHPLQMRHRRREALREADLVILAGVPCDFRLDYGNHISHQATLIAANRSRADLTLNRRPDIAVLGDPARFVCRLAERVLPGEHWREWIDRLRQRDAAREAEIVRQAAEPTAYVNPVYLCRVINEALTERSIIVADGGDFVATASYIVRPPRPLSWLDPGPFGTLGVGAGFALGAKLCRPDADVWLLYGDGSAGYSLVEFDTFVRHNVPLVAIVGNDAGWTQIAREQVEILHDDVATTLAYSDYDRVAGGFGAVGYRLDDPELAEETLHRARQTAAQGKPVLVNALIGKTHFRKGSIAM